MSDKKDKKEKKEQKENVDKTHWRYRKNQEIAKKNNDKITGLKTKPFAPEKKKEEKPEVEAPALEESYTEKDAKDLTRAEQEDLLKFRKVNFSSKDKEADLVKKIVSSNPKKE